MGLRAAGRALVAAVSLALVVAAAPAEAGSRDAATRRAAGPTTVFAFADPEIVESSALVVRGGLFLTVNDAGNPGRLFVVDATGATVGTTGWAESPIDPEALAPIDDDEVWVGDTGGNLTPRTSVQVMRLPFGREAQSLDPPVYDLAYPAGTHDAEALLANPRTGRLFVITKVWTGEGTLYRAPKRLSTTTANPLKAIGTMPAVVTDASFFPDGHHVILRDYKSATVYAFPSLTSLGTFALPEQRQGEGLGVDEDGKVYLSSEGQFSEVVKVPLPKKIKKAMKKGATKPTA